jgi:hypothetical protein
MAHLRIQEGQYTQRIYGLVCSFIHSLTAGPPVYDSLRFVVTADQGAELWRGGADSKLRAAEPPKGQPLNKTWNHPSKALSDYYICIYVSPSTTHP